MAISAWDERMLRVVVFDSTHTQGSSRYFLITITKQDTGKELTISKNPQIKTSTKIKPANQQDETTCIWWSEKSYVSRTWPLVRVLDTRWESKQLRQIDMETSHKNVCNLKKFKKYIYIQSTLTLQREMRSDKCKAVDEIDEILCSHY